MSVLDDPALYALDQSGMFGHVKSVGTEFIRAWAATESMEGPAPKGSVDNVIIAGVGGSATAGDYAAAICAGQSEIPMTVVRGFSLPNYVNRRTLVVICSYSGNTEEALACYDDARNRAAQLLVVSRGGALERRASGDGVPRHHISYEAASPRATTAHTLAPLLRLALNLGLTPIDDAAIEQAGNLHTTLVTDELAPGVPEAKNGAKQLAAALHGRVPFVMGAEHLAPAAARFRNQLAENGKSLGAAESLPEAGHNLVVGLATASRHAEHLALVTLESLALNHPRIRERFGIIARLFRDEGIPAHRLTMPGETVLDQLLTATAWGDYVSCYVALLNHVDPTPIPQIDEMKLNSDSPAAR